jgi:hypothetical protein
MVADGLTQCVDARHSPLSCGSDASNELLIIISSIGVLSSIGAFGAVMGFTLRRWVVHGTSVRTLPGSHSHYYHSFS